MPLSFRKKCVWTRIDCMHVFFRPRLRGLSCGSLNSWSLHQTRRFQRFQIVRTRRRTLKSVWTEQKQRNVSRLVKCYKTKPKCACLETSNRAIVHCRRKRSAVKQITQSLVLPAAKASANKGLQYQRQRRYSGETMLLGQVLFWVVLGLF